MKRNIIIFCMIILVGLVLFGALIWPTLYCYEEVAIGKTTFPVRISRLTGNKEYKLITGEWKPLILRKSEIPSNESLKNASEESKQIAETADSNVKNAPQTYDQDLFVIQVGVLEDMETAKQLSDELMYKGYDVRIEKPTSAGENLYRISVGAFQNEAEATSLAEKLRKQEGLLYEITRSSEVKDAQNTP